MLNFSIQWHDTVESTNTFLHDQLRQKHDLPAGVVIAAHHQTAGKGRYTRRWQSRPGKNLTFSLLLRPRVPLEYYPSLPMAVALGIQHYLEGHALPAKVKWPNDVLVGNKKICGILSEYLPAVSATIVGIGINLNMGPEEASQIDKPATSLYIETGVKTTPKTALDDVLQAISPMLGAWEKAGFNGLRPAWLQHVAYLHEPIQVGEGKYQKKGVLTDFGPHGELILQQKNGETIPVILGDLTPSNEKTS